MIDLLIKYPTRSRPELFKKTLALYQQDSLPRFLITIDADDATMNTPAMLEWMDAQPRLKYRIGNSSTKIEAINDGLAEESFDLLIVAADDMIPTVPNYAQRIAGLFADHFPAGDGVLHLNDGRTGRNLNTLPIMDRKYFDRFGYVYDGAYSSLWADNEFQSVSELLGRSCYIDCVLIRHAWTEVTGKDDLHLRNEAFYESDRLVYESRKSRF